MPSSAAVPSPRRRPQALTEARRLWMDAAAISHGPELRRYLDRRISPAEAAADAHQEVLLRFGTSAAPEDVRCVRSYLRRIARNIVIDWARRRDIETRLFSPTPVEVASSDPLPGDVMAEAQERALLRAAIGRLSERHRTALLLHRIEELPLAEIGRRLGVSESMASRYVYQAIRHCKAAMDSC